MNKVLGVAIRAMLLACAVGFCSGVGAANERPEPNLYAQLFAAAQRFSGYSCKDFKWRDVRSAYCHAIPVLIAPFESDGMLGMFLPDHPDHIQVTDKVTPGTIVWQSIIVHEYVHYLQWLHGKDTLLTTTCDSVVDSEEEAYAAQGKFLKDRGLKPDDPTLYLFLRRTACHGDDEPPQ